MLSNYKKVYTNYREVFLSVLWFVNIMSTVGHGIAIAMLSHLVLSGSTPNSKNNLESFKNYCKLNMFVFFFENHKAQKNM